MEDELMKEIDDANTTLIAELVDAPTATSTGSGFNNHGYHGGKFNVNSLLKIGKKVLSGVTAAANVLDQMGVPIPMMDKVSDALTTANSMVNKQGSAFSKYHKSKGRGMLLG
jgi:hypothetical protein